MKANPNSHTHCEAKSQAWQRVCLPYQQKKKLIISNPSKNFINANSKPDTKTLGHWVAILISDKGIVTRTTRTPGHNRRLAQWRVTWLIAHFTSHQLLWCIDSFVLQNPPLRQVPNH